MIDQLRNGPDPASASPSITGLLSGIVKDMQELTRQQLTLFKEEVKDDFRKTREVAVSWAIGLGAAGIGILLLAFAVAHLLAWGTPLPLWASFGIVGAAALAAGGALLYAGQKKLESFNPLPEQTVRALKENVQCLTNPK